MSGYILKPTDFVTITAPFLNIPDLSFEQKGLLSKVSSMQGDKRVLASNAYFAKLFSVENRSIQRWIKDLEKKGYLIVKYSQKANGQDERELYVNLSMIPDIGTDKKARQGDDKMSPPHGKLSSPSRQDATPPRQNVTLSNELVKDSINKISLSIPGYPVEDNHQDEPFDSEAFFEKAFWQSYPRKEKKGLAREMWRELNPASNEALFMLHCVDYLIRTHWRDRPMNMIPLPTTWLSEERWTDEIAHGWITEVTKKASTEKSQQELNQSKEEIRMAKEEADRIRSKIQEMSDLQKRKLKGYVINKIPLKMQKDAQTGKLGDLIEQLMHVHYRDWAESQKTDLPDARYHINT